MNSLLQAGINYTWKNNSIPITINRMRALWESKDAPWHTHPKSPSSFNPLHVKQNVHLLLFAPPPPREEISKVLTL